MRPRLFIGILVPAVLTRHGEPNLRHTELMMFSRAKELAIREDVFRWLDERMIDHGGYEIHHSVLRSYHYGEMPLPLLDRGKGIRNPRQFSSTLSIMTGWKKNPYQDAEDESGWVTYSYRAGDGGDNTKLVQAWANGDPIVYFRAVREGYYLPYYPITLAQNDPEQRFVRFPLDPGLSILGDPLTLTYTDMQRRYAESIVKTRLHQPMFRARVLHAYDGACTVCDLKHSELLDAAHIVPDADERGIAHVTNGLAMCKLHHAAYDRSLMAITPDYEIRIDAQLLDEVDGPMLRHGLQDMHGHEIRLPSNRNARPSPELLAAQFDKFARRTGPAGGANF